MDQSLGLHLQDLLPQDQRRKGKQNFHLGLYLINKTHRNSASLNLFRMITGGSWCILVHHWSWTSDEWWSLMSFPNWSPTVGSWFGGKDGYLLLPWEESKLFSPKHWHYPLTSPWWMRGLRDGCITEYGQEKKSSDQRQNLLFCTRGETLTLQM